MMDVLTIRRSSNDAVQTYELVGPDGESVLDSWRVNTTGSQDDFNHVMVAITATAYNYLRRDDQNDAACMHCGRDESKHRYFDNACPTSDDEYLSGFHESGTKYAATPNSGRTRK